MNRRIVIKNFLMSIGGLSALQNLPFINLDSLTKDLKEYSVQSKILPNALKKGDTIAITSPASPTSMYEIRHSVRYFKSLGLKVDIGDSVKKQSHNFRYLAGSDDDRVKEFIDYVKNPNINAIIAARGGYGVLRILHKIDFSIIKNNPKIIVGFSDITALINAIYIETGLITFHGPVASVEFDYLTKHSFENTLISKKENVKETFNDLIVINEGTSTGEICGGNLTMINALLGTKYEIDTKGKILLIEEVSEHAYEIDRMLNQLRIAGKLEEASAIIFGRFKNLHSRKPFFPNKGYTIFEVIEQIVKPLGIPTVLGLPFGHTKEKLTLPIGGMAHLNTKRKIFSIIDNNVLY